MNKVLARCRSFQCNWHGVKKPSNNDFSPSLWCGSKSRLRAMVDAAPLAVMWMVISIAPWIGKRGKKNRSSRGTAPQDNHKPHRSVVCCRFFHHFPRWFRTFHDFSGPKKGCHWFQPILRFSPRTLSRTTRFGTLRRSGFEATFAAGKSGADVENPAFINPFTWEVMAFLHLC